MDEATCLCINPFEGDMGGSLRVLKDKFVKTRKPHACFECKNIIKKGERSRTRAEIFEGELISFRWCLSCCNKMMEPYK